MRTNSFLIPFSSLGRPERAILFVRTGKATEKFVYRDVSKRVSKQETRNLNVKVFEIW